MDFEVQIIIMFQLWSMIIPHAYLKEVDAYKRLFYLPILIKIARRA